MKAVLTVVSLVGLLVVAVIVMKLNAESASSVQSSKPINQAVSIEAKTALSVLQGQLRIQHMQKQTYEGADLSRALPNQNAHYMLGVVSVGEGDAQGYWVGNTDDELIDIVEEACPDCRLEKDRYKIIAIRWNEQDEIDAFVINHQDSQPRPFPIR